MSPVSLSKLTNLAGKLEGGNKKNNGCTGLPQIVRLEPRLAGPALTANSAHSSQIPHIYTMTVSLTSSSCKYPETMLTNMHKIINTYAHHFHICTCTVSLPGFSSCVQPLPNLFVKSPKQRPSGKTHSLPSTPKSVFPPRPRVPK